MCKVCQKEKIIKNSSIIHYDKTMGIYLIDTVFNDSYTPVQVKYCPFCGHKLK